MNNKKQLLICTIFFMNWVCMFSQNDKTKIDSLKNVVQIIEDQTKQQLQSIDSLKLKLNEFELSQRKLDSLKTVRERLKINRDKQCEALNIELIDSLDIFKLKSGYYARILPQENYLEKFYNEIEWFYVSELNELKVFTTANNEHCMHEMYFKSKPKKIYRQIIKNQEEFDSLYLKCNEGQAPQFSEIINGELIVLSKVRNSNCINDVLIFQRKGIIRRIRTKNGIENYEYEFIGK